jgi:hypothetical protein
MTITVERGNDVTESRFGKNAGLAKKREILIFPRTAGNTGK